MSSMSGFRDRVTSRGVFVLCALVAAATGISFAGIVDTSIGAGIGTRVDDAFGDGSQVRIETSIAAVRYDPPVATSRAGLAYYEVTGVIEGIGWGGVHQNLPPSPPGPPVEAQVHYSYRIPFVLRWPSGFSGTLVYYGHGFSTLADTLLLDSILGPANEGRRYEVEGTFISDAVVDQQRKHGYFAANMGGIGRDGSFTALALEGPFTGEPLVPSIDVPLARDMARVAARLLARLSGRPVARIYGAGHSGGALVMQFIDSGLTTTLFGPPVPVQTGGNFVEAYAPASGRIFAGFVPLAGSDIFVHPLFPLTAPIILIGGTADYAAVDSVSYAGRLRSNGVVLDDMVRIYQIANMPHAFAEIPESGPNQVRAIEEFFGVRIGRESDRMMPVVAAAIDNLDRWVVKGTPPPPSLIAGRPDDSDGDGMPDIVHFPQAGGLETPLFPYVEDPSIDETDAFQVELSAANGLAGLVRRYAQVLGAHTHQPAALRLPYQTCRLGGYELSVSATLVAFADLTDRWPGFGDYNSCLRRAADVLGPTGLYDAKLGRRVLVRDYIRELFNK